MAAIPDSVEDDAIMHVEPIDDLRKHDTVSRGLCWCRPDIEESEGGYVVVHHAMDGREQFEDGRRKLS